MKPTLTNSLEMREAKFRRINAVEILYLALNDEAAFEREVLASGRIFFQGTAQRKFCAHGRSTVWMTDGESQGG
jgi:hypothetical protein